MMGKPKIRFKGYNEDWEQRKFIDIATRGSSVCTSASDIPSVEYEDVVAEEGRLNKDIRSKEAVKSGITFDGSQVLYGKLRPYLHNWLNPDFKGVAVGDWWVLKPINVDKNFLYRLIQTQQFDNIANQSSGSKMPRADWNLISNSEFMVPLSKKEQSKIGRYFDNLDHLITLHQHKCDEMKKLKKYMLQKMFPKNGKKVPEIRFDGFTNDWEQRKFSELVMIERGGSPRPIDKYITKAENGLNWVKIGDAPEQSNYITKTSEKIIPEGLSKTREVHPGDLILSNSMSFGRPYIMAIDGCIHDGWLAIRDTEKRFDLKFLCTLLGTDSMLNQYKAMAAGSTVNNLNKELVGSTIVSFPKMDEQTKIGEYFTNLDHLITLHQHKCDELQNFKKYMLQNMFV